MKKINGLNLIKQNQKIKNLFDQMNPIIQNYMDQNSIDIL